MKKVVLFIAIFCMAIGGCTYLPTKVDLATNPKVANYWTSPTMTKDEARELAQFHLVIADMENIKNNPDSLKLLKRLNPKIKLLAYSNPMEFFVPMVSNRPLQKKASAEVREKYSDWFLKQPGGNPVIFWKGMQMLNLSNLCPEINGLRWNQYHAQFLLKNVLSDPIWDGYFMDNSGGNVSWIMNGQIDADNDGAQDNPEKLDQAWSSGIHEFLRIIREAKGADFIMIGNKMTPEFLDVLDGKMSEEFPNNYLGDKKADGWYQTIGNYAAAGPYAIIQARQTANNGEYRTFMIASALMADGYYAYGQDLCRRFPEYRDIGKALGPAAEKEEHWIREFEKATVKVWPYEKKGEIIYK